MVAAVTIAGFVAGSRIGRRDGSSPTSPIVAQYTAHYRDVANLGDPSVAQRAAQYCDVPNPTHPSVALALAVHHDDPNPRHPSLAHRLTRDYPNLGPSGRLAQPQAQPDRADKALRPKRVGVASR